MKRDFSGLAQEVFDIVIVGGGIIGTGIARDAALRGLNTVLVEKEDFAYGTTSRSSRLIHGGLRYLRMLEFKLVRQDLRERETLLSIAPHLVHRLQFIIPLIRSSLFYRFALPFGLRMYDILSAGKTLPSWQRLSQHETLELEPWMSETGGLMGSYLYYDCQSDFIERLCLENALDAAEHGARMLNHAAMTGFLTRDSAVCGIEVRDTQSGENHLLNGRIVLNAGGPWANLVWDKLVVNKTAGIRKTKGIHLLTGKISNNALVLFARSDGRLFFVIPWQGYSLIGTTDTDYFGNLDTVHANVSDVDYLVSELRHYFPGFRQEDIHYTVAGLRPLVAVERKVESNTSRAHKLVDHEQRDGIRGFISVLGGKITAYRAIAEKAVDLVCHKLRRKIPCSTAYIPLPGSPAVPAKDIEQAAYSHGLPPEVVTHLAAIYGSRFSSVLEYVAADERLGRPVSAGCRDIIAQIKHAVDEEEAITVGDFLLRRSPLGLGASQGMDAVEMVAREMGSLLGWGKADRQSQIDGYRASVALGRRFRE